MALRHDQAADRYVLYKPIFGELVVKFKREHIVLLPPKGFREREKADKTDVDVGEIEQSSFYCSYSFWVGLKFFNVEN